MGHSHGHSWTEEQIEKAIRDVMEKAKISSMPTHSLMDEITGSKALSVQVSRHGGTKYWAQKLSLEVKKCESKLGYEYECECANYLMSRLGIECELTKARYPYDIIANGNIKIDVKSSNLCHCSNGAFYTFNLEKPHPTCDIFVCYCLNEEKIVKTYIIPSCVLSGKTQLSVGEHKSKYDKYIDNWGIVQKYAEFYDEMTK